MRTIVYVDGFNLYHRAVKGTPYRWLNILDLCQRLLPAHTIEGIKYYTAYVKARPGNPDQPLRQQAYLRALRTLPNLQIFLGTFLSNPAYRPLVNPPPGKSRWVHVIETEEKGSDVNLATHIVHDAHVDRYDAAAVVSSDSDLVEPIRIVTQELQKNVVILYPDRKKKLYVKLRQAATFVKPIRVGALKSTQFPDQLTDRRGTFHKPRQW